MSQEAETAVDIVKSLADVENELTSGHKLCSECKTLAGKKGVRRYGHMLVRMAWAADVNADREVLYALIGCCRHKATVDETAAVEDLFAAVRNGHFP